MGFKSIALASTTLIFSANVNAATVFSEDFNSFTSTSLGTQNATGLVVGNDGTLAGWNVVGAGGLQAVDHTGAGDWGMLLYNGYNTSGSQAILTSTTGISANNLGETYSVTFDLGATIYEHFSQGTSSSDAVVFQILRGDDSVLSSYIASAGAWTGVQTFASEGFQYTGDGSGTVNIRINSLSVGDNLLSGAIDNIDISTSAVPVPAAVWLFSSGLLGLIGVARRK